VPAPPGEPLAGVTRADLDRARIHPVRLLPPGTSAMTFGRHVLVRRDRLGDAALLHHELVHVRQWREQGVAGFLARYLAAYLRGRLRGLGHWDAYRAIPAEREAREAAGR
jgi:hypothetical protein